MPLDFRVCLSDTHYGERKYLWCKNCHKIITVTPKKMCFTKIEGDLSDFVLLDTRMVVNARCEKCMSNFVEIHEDTINAHRSCADLGISIFYDYGEIVPYDPDIITRNWKGDRPIFKFPSLEILDLGSEEAEKCMYDIISKPTGLIFRQRPGFSGRKFYVKFDAIIRTNMAKDKDELCSVEYFNKMDEEIQYARDKIEEIINKLIAAVS